MQRTKTHLATVLKISFAISIIYWMVSTEKLDFKKTKILFEYPHILAACLTAWLLCTVFLNSMRWKILVNAIGLKLTSFQAVKVSMVGLLFNNFMPGAVGGDLIKAIFLFRNHPGGAKTPALLTIFLDRLIGVSALFLLSIPFILYNWTFLQSSQVLQGVVGLTLFLALCVFLFMVFVFISWPKGNDPLEKVLSLNIIGFSILRKIYSSLREYRNKPKAFLLALSCSTISMVMLVTCIGLIANTLSATKISPLLLFTIMPIGMVVTAIPISPGGLGVGHIAFERLFLLLGSAEGANIYNIFFLTNTLPNLLGIFIYVFGKDKKLEYSIDQQATSIEDEAINQIEKKALSEPSLN